MPKYLKFYIESDEKLSDIIKLAKGFMSDHFDSAKMFAWDTENPDDAYFPPKKEPCGRAAGKVAGKPLICGENDYLCPECRDA